MMAVDADEPGEVADREAVGVGEPVQVGADRLAVDGRERDGQQTEHASPGLSRCGGRASSGWSGDGPVEFDVVEAGSGDLLAAAEDGVEGGFADEVGQAADHSGGAVVKVAAQLEQDLRAVGPEPQCLLQRRHQGLPGLLVLGRLVGESAGGDFGVAAGDLPAATAGEQAGALDVDASQDERGRDALGQVLDLVGCLRADLGADVEVV